MDVIQCLKENNLKATKSRIKIMSIIYQSEQCLSAMDIYNKLDIESIDIDLSTVYRTLETLYNHEIVDKFDLGEGKYNYKLKEKGHKHLIECEICHKHVEIDCPMQQVQEYVKAKTGLTLLDSCVNLNRGICKDCSSENKKQ
ncbi:Fur family transcriptional regulator [Clostridium sp. UBA4548]|uniref:Fur family transcriptional regulator n=1 Tax=Clostridium sp. UBA4548 TaxID=1946361 RepID=UPI0025C59B42|nr:Fur family transcriptional regulator [Clostridium sp. UBA4548]